MGVSWPTRHFQVRGNTFTLRWEPPGTFSEEQGQSVWVGQTGNWVEEVVRPERRGLAVAGPRGICKPLQGCGILL